MAIVFGIAALVGLGSLSVSLASSIHRQARELLGADLVFSSRRPFPAEMDRRLAASGARRADDVAFSSMAAFPTDGGATRLVQVRAMEGGFPFYGAFVTDPPGIAARLGESGAVAILEPALLSQYRLKIGDPVRLGRTTFTIIGAVQKLPGESVALSLFAPRVIVPMAALERTGLGGRESLVRHRAALKLPAGVDPDAFGRRLREEFPGAELGVETPASRERELGRTFTRLYGFLSLAGFVALLLGAIGVASAVQLHVRRKLATVAVLRCLGAAASQGFGVYLAQAAAMGLVGVLLGAGLGIGLQLVLAPLIQPWLPIPVDLLIAWPAVLRGALAGFGVCLLFALPPLLAVRGVPPLAALRPSVAGLRPRRDPWAVAVAVAILAATTAFARVQTHSWRLGAGFSGMLVLGFAALAVLARALVWAVRRWRPARLPFAVRQGVANLHRPDNRTVLLLVSLGLGIFLALTLVLVRTTLLREMGEVGGGGRPNLMFFDVQDDQIGRLDSIAAKAGVAVTDQAPLVTMRIASVNGRTPDEMLADRGGGIPGWTLRREYRCTYRDHLSATERLVAGAFAPRAPSPGAPAPISVEAGLARDLRLRLGDEIVWDVQGVPVRTRVASFRRVEWRRLEPNFFVVFPSGVLEGAPQTYLAALRAPTPADSARVQQAAAAALPNVSAIDLTVILQTLDGLLGKVEFGIECMAFFTAATGLVVLAGAAWGGRAQRVREAALLRTLGASSRQLAHIQLSEYAALGLLAAAAGALLAVLANALLARFVFDTQAAAPAALILAACGSAVAVVLAAGWLANRGVARHPPLETLRREE